MQLHERLKDLIGHEVFVTTQIENEGKDVPGGTLKEVGLDYLIIKTEDEVKGGHAIIGADWWVRLGTVIAITHPSDCPRCAIDAATS